MKNQRWYEENSQLKIIMETLSSLSEEVQVAVANDVIQMILEHKSNYTDEFIEKIHLIHYPVGRRWYDKNETVLAAIEMIKHIEKEKQQDLLLEILYSILYFNQTSPSIDSI
ncbi:MAG: hypothetical protein WCK67_04835 [bacterium]